MKHRRAYTNLDAEQADLEASFKVLRDRLPFPDDSPEDEALAGIETFVAIALRVLRKTNPSKIRDEARTTEIQALCTGVPVIERHERKYPLPPPPRRT